MCVFSCVADDWSGAAREQTLRLKKGPGFKSMRSSRRNALISNLDMLRQLSILSNEINVIRYVLLSFEHDFDVQTCIFNMIA